ncbi:F-box protein [Rosa sericea]
MNPRKRQAVIRSIRAKGEQWQPTGPCRIRQLPTALVMEILSRLTPNTLINCRCVCKSWLFVISHPHFNRLLHSRSPIGILIQTFPHPIRWKGRILEFTQIVECAAPDLQLEKLSFRPKVSIPLIGDKEGFITKYGLLNSCNGLLCLSGPKRNDTLYVCNPILGEFITTPPLKNGIDYLAFNGLGFSAATNEYKVLKTCQATQAQIYTIGTGVWRDIGQAPFGNVRFPFNAFLHGALHWATQYWSGYEFMHSFNFETEKFQTIPPPSHFAPKRKLKERVTLGVLGGCLLLCAFEDDRSKFDMWVMKDYGVQESWTKFLVIENLSPTRSLTRADYEPIMFLSNGEILMSYGASAVVCYNPETKSFKETSIGPIGLGFVTTAYSPSFVSLNNISKGEEVESVRDNENFNKLFRKGSSSSACSGRPPHKSTKLNPGYCQPVVQEGLPRPRIITSSVASSKLNPGYCPPAVQEGLPNSRAKTCSLGFTLRIGSECAICGGQLGYVFRGKGFAMCQQCFDSSSS